MFGFGTIGPAILGAAAALCLFMAEAGAGDWQVWIPPAGRAANPPPYDQWERYDYDEDNLVSLDDCQEFVLFEQILDADEDTFDRLDAGICFNAATRDIYPAVE